MTDKPPDGENPSVSGPSQKERGPSPGENRRPRKKRFTFSFVRKFLLFLTLAVGLFFAAEAGYFWWQNWERFVSTDNAYVKSTLTPVSTEIAGVVKKLLVKDNQAVRIGELLVVLDKRRHEVALKKAKAAVAVARAKYEASKVSVTHSMGRATGLQQEARARLETLRRTLRSARALLIQRKNETRAHAATKKQAREDLNRKLRLHGQKIISDENLALVRASHDVARANYDASQAALNVEENKVSAIVNQMEEAQASVALAENEDRSRRIKSHDADSLKAELEEALADYKEKELLLSYTEIRAPVSGYVEKSVDPGTFVQPGRPLLLIVQLEKAYIRANFKEIKLEGIHVGQPAEIVLDAYPNRTFKGHIASLYSGTGETFSLLPPENATGNWVKVTRRIPVKILLDEKPPKNFPLLVGMSAYVTVDTKIRRGPRLLAYPVDKKPQNQKP
ncbi:MAG: HlyD family secretion protein [Nitrospinae bacterium]|nr:HlyD family secretion protein [Nitrospinota bacterium]